MNYGLFLALGWSWVSFSPLVENLRGYGYDLKVDRTAYVGGYGYVSPDPWMYALSASLFTGARGNGRGKELTLSHGVIRLTVGYRYVRWRVRERNFDIYPFVGFGYGRVAVSFATVGDLSYPDFVEDPARGGTMHRGDYLGTVGLGALFDFGFTLGMIVGYDAVVARESWFYGSDRLTGGPDVSPYGPYARFMVGYAGDWGE